MYAGDIILVRPGQIHSISQHDNDAMEYENILFRPDLLYSQNTDLRTLEYFDLYFNPEYDLPWHIDHSNSSHKELAECINAIDTLCSERPRYYELSVKAYLFQFFYLLFSGQKTPVYSTGRKSLDKVKQMIAYIEEHYMEPITVQSAADYMGFSNSHFMKFFKQNMHTTFTSYLNHYRLTIAGRLLLTTDDNILVISEKTGFNNLSYFNRLFKQYFHMTPREYRMK